MAKALPAVKVIHSDDLKASNLSAVNKRHAKSREAMRAQYAYHKTEVSEEQLLRSYPEYKVEDLKKNPGFYVFIKGSKWGPFPTAAEAKAMGDETAYELTYS